MDSTKPTGPTVRRRRDVDVRGVFLFGLFLAVGGVVTTIAMWGLFRVLEKRQEGTDKLLPPQVVVSLRRTPPEPRLERDPLAPRRALRAEEDARLKSYGWIDRTAGKVRIPIDRAMEIVLERGIPGGKPMAAGAPAPAAPASTGVSSGPGAK